ncbi:MAG: cephalosporin hydroxylase [Parcubacteria group bacterium Gr01-1014_33]|nr:MAG: cephalosporin hydroxylase [Parcubacteria group bacterium Gr01-1014_33]
MRFDATFMKLRRFPTEKEVDHILQFVTRKKDKDVERLAKDAHTWTRTAWENRMDYEVRWLGVPIIQNPYDMLLMQELIFALRPDLIIETGIAHGGSLVYYASLLELLGRGKVVGVDVDIRAHNRKHLESHPMKKRMTLLEGSSADPAVLARIRKLIKPGDKVLVCLDSDHRGSHVHEELHCYKGLVTKGSYLVVFDTFIPYLKGLKGLKPEVSRDTPMDAVDRFLQENKNFKVDEYFHKFFVSSCPRGFLQKIR